VNKVNVDRQTKASLPYQWLLLGNWSYVLMALSVCCGCGEDASKPTNPLNREGEPPIIYVDENDAKMAAAMSKARLTVQDFIATLGKPKPAQTSFSVKVPIKDGDHTEHIWLMSIRFRDNQFVGKINNKPDRLMTVKLGDEVRVAPDQISDWMYADNGKLVGGFTVRVLRDNMTEDQRRDFDDRVPFVVVDDRKPDDPQVRLFDAIGNAEDDIVAAILKQHPELSNRKGSVVVPGLLGQMERESQSPLSYAVYCKNLNAAEILLENQANPRARDEHDNTPLHDAAMLGQIGIIRLLVKHGADVNAKNVIGLTPLKTAAHNDEIPSAMVLLELGANVRAKLSSNRQNVLHNVHSVAMAKALLTAGAEIDAKDNDEQTPLHVALVNKFTDVAVYLIQQGADVKVRDKEGCTPIDVARNSLEGNDLAKILKAVGEKPAR
jgi:uncharacterized protein YegJ (DUF2314 family)/ankyrin repeat protein